MLQGHFFGAGFLMAIHLLRGSVERSPAAIVNSSKGSDLANRFKGNIYGAATTSLSGEDRWQLKSPPANNHRRRSSTATSRQSKHQLGLTIPLIEEQLLEHLLIPSKPQSMTDFFNPICLPSAYAETLMAADRPLAWQYSRSNCTPNEWSQAVAEAIKQSSPGENRTTVHDLPRQHWQSCAN